MQPQIESKNLGLISDQMQHEALAVKKLDMYASQFQDPQLQQLATSLSGHHRAHFDALYQYLNSHQ